MSNKKLVLTLVADQQFVRHLDNDDPHFSRNEALFAAISDTWLPLLNMFANLEAEGIPFKLNLVMSPTLCDMFADPRLQLLYIEWLNRKITLGEAEIKQYEAGSVQYTLANRYLADAKQNLHDFTEILNQDIISKIVYYAKRGNIELLATTATQCFLPHFADIPEAVQAQIEVGLQSHKRYFGVAPDGFYMPYMAYGPALEWIIRPYGFNYTILDTHGILFADPQPEQGIFYPVRTRNSLALFARDSSNTLEYHTHPVYRSQEYDIGFDADESYLTEHFGAFDSRVATGYKYYAQGTTSSERVFYDEEMALDHAKKDACAFYAEKCALLDKAAELCTTEMVVDTCVFDINMFGGKWFEGIDFLDELLRNIAFTESFDVSCCTDLLENQFNLQKIEPFPCAACGEGYGENLLSHSNGWMLRYVRKACERMIDLAGRFTDDTGLKSRYLNLAAKEVLMAMDGSWPAMIDDQQHPDYAEYRFKESVGAFSTVYESLGSNNISTEWLTRMEKRHTLFEDINYHVFKRKD